MEQGPDAAMRPIREVLDMAPKDWWAHSGKYRISLPGEWMRAIYREPVCADELLMVKKSFYFRGIRVVRWDSLTSFDGRILEGYIERVYPGP
jgi:hypothetical protein